MPPTLTHHKPCPPLAPFVSDLWLCEGTPPAHTHERVLPYGRASVILNLAEDRIFSYDRHCPANASPLGGVIVAGPRSQFEVIDTQCQRLLAEVSLRPAGAALFLGVPAHELADLDISLDALWGPAARRLRDRMLEASTPRARLVALERALLERLPRRTPPPAIVYAAAQLTRAEHASQLAAIAHTAGLSQRRFIELFRHHTGIAPKLFHRVQRFQAAIQRAYGGEHNSWTDLALTCGYYDQSHFVHDFRAFSGLTPTEYDRLRGPYANHVILPDS